jgi:hypothetical protein
MPAYRINFLDENANISGPPVVLQCASDDEAKKQAHRYTDGKNIELWREGTLLALLPAR